MSTAAPSPMANPLADNPLRSRADLQRACRDLVRPVVAHLSPGGARARLGSAGAGFSIASQELEGYARPLWGLVPLAVGGGDFDGWDRWVAGLAAGTDPEHPEHWGPVTGMGQRMVEMAAIGFALAFVPERLWDPLPASARDRVVDWLRAIFEHEPVDNNWQFFRVLVALGLDRLDVGYDQQALQRSFDLLESFDRGGGWYEDGSNATYDLYVPMAFHVYGLIYATAPSAEPARAARYRERASAFAQDFQHWFDPHGACVPFGRSLTYRFAQGAFWGALAFADLEALPWPRVRGLWLRHLRWWAQHPISDRDGVLSVGYGYANLKLAEEYNSPGSPYWALKFFLGLGAGPDHPIWRDDEEPLEAQTAPAEQPEPGLVLSRDGHQVIALSGRHGARPFEQGEAKYARFAYHSRLGFAGRFTTRFGTPADSALTLVDAGGDARVRTEVVDHEVRDGAVWSRWQPWDDVVVDTVLVGRAPWHLRLHRVVTSRPLHTIDAGFCLPWGGWDDPQGLERADVDEERAVLARAGWLSGVRDLSGGRRGSVALVAPNANVLHPRTLLPQLEGDLEPGDHRLCTAVVGCAPGTEVDPSSPPTSLEAGAEALLARHAVPR